MALPPLKILLAAPRGFCAGVVRAIDIVERALEIYGAPVYVRHEIVHNKFVVDDLKSKGAIFVDELDEIPAGDHPVIFSAHGVPKAVPAEAQRRAMFQIDATCPLVTKVHMEAQRHHEQGLEIILIGHKGHPEVIGTMGQLPPGAITLIETVEDAEHVTVRSAEKLAAGQLPNKVVQGTVQDAEKIAQVVAGCQAVLSVLGPTSNTTDFSVSQGVSNILAAMKAHNVRRLVISVGAGVRDPKDRPTLVHAFFGTLVKLLARNTYDEMLRVSDIVRASDCDWTIVRVPRLTDSPMIGKIRQGYVGQDIGSQLTRGDMAAFMLRQVMDMTYLRQAPAISN